MASGANWHHFADLRHTFNHADVAKTNKGHPVVIFDVGETSTASLLPCTMTEKFVMSSAS